jgi:hypothetical protein
METLHELARTFLSPNGRERAIALFGFIQDLDPIYLPEAPFVLGAEYDAFRTRTQVIPALPPELAFATRLEVARLARGDFDARVESFIRRLDARKRIDTARFYPQYLALVERVAPRGSPQARKLRTYDDVLNLGSLHLGEQIRAVMYEQISTDEAARWAHRLDCFPTLRTIVHANAYLSALVIVHRQVPGRDKLDDCCHVIEAAYCDIFVTADEQLARVAPILHPGLTVLTFTDLEPAATEH